jgi:hypothetical protein
LESPIWGYERNKTRPLEGGGEKGVGMRLVKRIAIALGSLAALAVAGGAHWKL